MSIMKQDQRRLDNLAKAYHTTVGDIQEMWKKKWYELIKIIARRIRESKRSTTSLG